jgi:hypothetical protein
MNLQIIPAHPDRMAGLGFVETCFRNYLPFSFAVGTLAARGIANRVLHGHRSLAEFKVVSAVVIIVVVLICSSPFAAFFRTLLQAKRRGVFEYGSLATLAGRQFEQKWLGAARKVDQGVLEVQDFSATIVLYSVVANVDEMSLFPLKATSVSRLAIWSVLPCIPVVLASLPFEFIVDKLIKLLI